ncbi:MAG: C40 family peptidase [Ornithinimicrobium sp.]|uniref:C40 family peptidase n=1 Tax=Ornithinimicrobium sp. TaxID=1977084 RepID=UPI003D9AE562
MSSHTPGRHRAPSRLTVKPLARASAVLLASGGLAASMSVGAQAAPAPAAPKPAAPVTLPATPGALPQAPVEVPSVRVTLPTTPGSWTTLRWGSRGGQVATVQRIAGSYQDGIFGPKTHAAVKRYQARNGLEVDGIVGPITSRSMGLRSGSSSSSSRSDSASSRSSSRSSSSSSSSSSSYSSGGIVGQAQRYLGIMYRWAGSTPAGFDCSGYTQYVYGKAGISIPRTTQAQQRAAYTVSSPRPGDLVFWGYPAYHVAIYAGDGMIYDSGKPGLPSQKRAMFSGSKSFGRIG